MHSVFDFHMTWRTEWIIICLSVPLLLLLLQQRQRQRSIVYRYVFVVIVSGAGWFHSVRIVAHWIRFYLINCALQWPLWSQGNEMIDTERSGYHISHSWRTNGKRQCSASASMVWHLTYVSVSVCCVQYAHKILGMYLFIRFQSVGLGSRWFGKYAVCVLLHDQCIQHCLWSNAKYEIWPKCNEEITYKLNGIVWNGLE